MYVCHTVYTCACVCGYVVCAHTCVWVYMFMCTYVCIYMCVVCMYNISVLGLTLEELYSYVYNHNHDCIHTVKKSLISKANIKQWGTCQLYHTTLDASYDD